MLAVIREGSFVIMLGKWSLVLLVLMVAAIGLVAPILVDTNHWFPRKEEVALWQVRIHLNPSRSERFVARLELYRFITQPAVKKVKT